MKAIVLFCKSYRKDFLRLKRLLTSIKQFNVDDIPFYISTPEADNPLLLEMLGNQHYHWVSDESIIAANPNANENAYRSLPGSLSQAIIKSEFWRLSLSENYVCLDSDSIFLKEFWQSDFLAQDGNPYTVLHQNTEFFQLAINRGHRKVVNNLTAEAERTKQLFKRQGKTYYCAPSPFIWSAKVWKSLEINYLQPKEITIWQLITTEQVETLIYAEALLNYQAIPIRAIEPIFRVYHYPWHYYLLKRIGESEQKLRANFMGVIYQSNWQHELDFGKLQKSVFSRMLRSVKRLFSYLRSSL